VDVVLFADYELQVDALLDRQIDVAWNSPLAWVDAQRRSHGSCRAIAMRDTDRDRQSFIVVPAMSAIQSVADLRGRTLAVGALDSPQATLIPLGLLQRSGLEPGRDVTVRRFDVLVGKHGDHVGGELDAFRCLERGEADASTVLDLVWKGWTRDGTADPARWRILASTDRFDHCVFTVRADFEPERERRFLEALFSMSYDDPDHRKMMDMEGLRQWLPGRTSGFGPLQEAVERQRFFAAREGGPG
jgi:ABC-type phosphate/phosphonate transport system substrate-binding protein